MKTLKESLLSDNEIKESLLSDIDTNLAQGDEWEKNFKGEIKEFLKAFGTAKNYEGGYSLKNGRSTGFFVPNTLQELGYDANHIRLLMYTMDSFNYTSSNDNWAIEISLSKRSDDNMKHICTVWEKKVYMDRWIADNWRGIVKNVIKPATKSLDQFKKFLINMEKLNGQYISPSSLLK
jgi:hypothetical protein